MTLYAHVSNGTIDSIGQPPQLLYDGDRWWDLRQASDADLAERGWLPVAPTPRPPDTPTTTFDYSVTLVQGAPTETWTERPKTQAEITSATTSANAVTLTDQTAAQVATLLAILGATSDPAGTNTLRAVKNTTNATINASPAAYVKAVNQSLIDVVQAAVRLSRLTGRALDSTNVG